MQSTQLYLVDGHSIVHVVVRMGEVPASIAPGLTTIVLVVRVVQHWDHVVLLACDIRVHTGGNTPERHTHQSFAAYPHCLTCKNHFLPAGVLPGKRSYWRSRCSHSYHCHCSNGESCQCCTTTCPCSRCRRRYPSPDEEEFRSDDHDGDGRDAIHLSPKKMKADRCACKTWRLPVTRMQ